MNRKEARKAAEVMLAYADGKEIEYEARSGWNTFVNSEPVFNWHDCNYRIKPTPIYRPFANVKECWEEMKKHEPFGWIKEESRDYGTILRSLMFINYTECCFGLGYRKTFADGFKCFTFADGTPFGKLTEEE